MIRNGYVDSNSGDRSKLMLTRAEILKLGKANKIRKQKSDSEKANILAKQVHRLQQRANKHQEAINGINSKLTPLLAELQATCKHKHTVSQGLNYPVGTRTCRSCGLNIHSSSH